MRRFREIAIWSILLLAASGLQWCSAAQQTDGTADGKRVSSLPPASQPGSLSFSGLLENRPHREWSSAAGDTHLWTNGEWAEQSSEEDSDEACGCHVLQPVPPNLQIGQTLRTSRELCIPPVARALYLPRPPPSRLHR